MILAVVIVSFLMQSQSPAPAEALIRVCVLPAGDAGAVDFRESAKDLSASLADKKKDLLIVTELDRPDVTITVVDRSVTVLKFAVGVMPTGRPGAPATGPVRAMHITVTLARLTVSCAGLEKQAGLHANRSYDSLIVLTPNTGAILPLPFA